MRCHLCPELEFHMSMVPIQHITTSAVFTLWLLYLANFLLQTELQNAQNHIKGKEWRPKMGPSWHHDGPKWAPGWPQKDPKKADDAPRHPHDPKLSPDGPKMATR